MKRLWSAAVLSKWTDCPSNPIVICLVFTVWLNPVGLLPWARIRFVFRYCRGRRHSWDFQKTHTGPAFYVLQFYTEMIHHKESKLGDLNMAFDQTATFTCHDLHGDRQGRLGYSSDMLKKPCSCKSPWKPQALKPFWFVCLEQWESKHRVRLTGTAPSGWFVLRIQKGFQNLEDNKHEKKKVYDAYKVMQGIKNICS